MLNKQASRNVNIWYSHRLPTWLPVILPVFALFLTACASPAAPPPPSTYLETEPSVPPPTASEMPSNPVPETEPPTPLPTESQLPPSPTSRSQPLAPATVHSGASPTPSDSEGLIASGGLVVEQSVEELTVAADHVIIARVQSVDSDWNADKTFITTTITLSVEELLQNPPFPPDVALVLPGGTAGDDRLMVADTPTFVPGQRVVLFLEGDGGPGTRLVSSWQGIYYIEGDDAVQPEMNRRIPLSELKDRIRAASA